ncbi:hypothetical protein [Clostridium sp.]|uniref:hypothetical protein n=1 Tax=Clostridium sp. TaxID=1506 RepID=UPI002FCA1395
MDGIKNKDINIENRILCDKCYRIIDRECGLAVFGEKIKIAQELLELNLLDAERVADATGLSVQDVHRLKGVE